MAYEINQGIGSPGGITPFLLFGLAIGAPVVVTLLDATGDGLAFVPDHGRIAALMGHQRTARVPASRRMGVVRGRTRTAAVPQRSDTV